MICVHIEVHDDGQVSCAARMQAGQTVTGADIIRLAGGMEVAKMALLAGRWGLMAKDGKSGQSFRPFNKDWERMAPAKKSKRSQGKS